MYSAIPWNIWTVTGLALLALVPLWRIFSRMGLPGYVSVLLFLPFFNLVVLWAVSFMDWPGVEKKVRG